MLRALSNLSRDSSFIFFSARPFEIGVHYLQIANLFGRPFYIQEILQQLKSNNAPFRQHVESI